MFIPTTQEQATELRKRAMFSATLIVDEDNSRIYVAQCKCIDDVWFRTIATTAYSKGKERPVLTRKGSDGLTRRAKSNIFLI
jgi:hypothetical protein